MLPDTPPLLTYSWKLRSRYGETDKMGYVYYGRYLEYFEVVRTEFIREAGLPYRTMEEQGIMMPVIESQVKYHQPVYYDALMDIRLMIFEKPITRLETWYQIFTEYEKPHVTGKVTLVFMNSETRRPVRAPLAFNQGIDRYVAKGME